MSENLIRRKSKVSDGRSVRVGLVGPKLRPTGVSDGQPVNIPVPGRGSSAEHAGDGQPPSGGRWQAGNARDAGPQGQK
jgi:hypothetical protein